jgi:hypothetical protein
MVFVISVSNERSGGNKTQLRVGDEQDEHQRHETSSVRCSLSLPCCALRALPDKKVKIFDNVN